MDLPVWGLMSRLGAAACMMLATTWLTTCACGTKLSVNSKGKDEAC